MNQSRKNKRKYRRAIFTLQDGILGHFILPNHQDESKSGPILNISEGGLFITLKRDNNRRLKKGDHITLTEIKGHKDLEFKGQIDTVIKWILDHESLECIGFGIQFNDLSEETRQKLRQFVNSWHIENDMGRHRPVLTIGTI